MTDEGTPAARDQELAHDGSPLLADQATTTRVAEGPAGLRIVSHGQVAAISAAVSAALAVKTAPEWWAM